MSPNVTFINTKQTCQAQVSFVSGCGQGKYELQAGCTKTPDLMGRAENVSHKFECWMLGLRTAGIFEVEELWMKDVGH